MKSKIYSFSGILTLFALTSIIVSSCSDEKVVAPEDTTLTVAFVNKNLVLNGDKNNLFDKSSPENSVVYVTPNSTITWELGEGLSSIQIRVDSGEAIFDVLPASDENGNYIAKVGNVEAGEAKYSVIYTVVGDDTVFVLDPVVKVNSGRD